jgi:cytochrome c peroxidase
MNKYTLKKYHTPNITSRGSFKRGFKYNISFIEGLVKNMLFTGFLLFGFSVQSFAQGLITPISEVKDFDKDKAMLGKMLFFDSRLSKDDTVSCATCHDLENGGDDSLSVSVGIEGKKGEVNAPTVLNARYNFVQFWDGRAKTLQEQASFPVKNPVEMGSEFKDIIKKLQKDEFYTERFEKLYEGQITEETITHAIAEFEKALVTPSRFDRYLLGDDDALSAEEKQGYELFKSHGCVSCHNGRNIGGNLYQKLGIVISEENEKWEGRFAVTKNKEDLYYFKVPTLRNISKTAPYLHSGNVKTLKETIEMMGYYQLGITLSQDQISKIEAFLKSLDGERPKILDQQ